MLKSFKTEMNPTEEQKVKIRKTIGTCRYVYNFYLAHNKELFEKGEPFMSGKSFSVWLNNEYLPKHPEYSWIKEVSSKSVKHSIECGCTAFSRFFKHQSAFPNFKKKGKSDVKMYFVKNNPGDCRCERHRINIPTLGWIRIKEKGYIPTTKDGYVIKSGSVSMKAGRFYVSALVEIPDPEITDPKNEGIGIDLGVKEFAICSNGRTYKNINKTIAEIVKTKPSYITIENLNVSGMMKNRHLSKAVASQKFYEFRVKLQAKCHENSIEFRVADRWYPSSRICHGCGCIKKDLKLSDRTYRCGCGYVEDRDLNAALNLRDAATYEVA